MKKTHNTFTTTTLNCTIVCRCYKTEANLRDVENPEAIHPRQIRDDLEVEGVKLKFAQNHLNFHSVSYYRLTLFRFAAYRQLHLLATPPGSSGRIK